MRTIFECSGGTIFNYLKIVKTEWRCRLSERNIEFLLHIKVEGPELKKFAEKMWDSKERRTTQRKCKNYNDRKTKQKPKRFINTYIDEFLLYG